MLIMSAKRGSLLFASETIRNHISRFYLAVTEPWGFVHGTDGLPRGIGGAFTWDETNGGVGCTGKHSDVQMVKYLFPSDPVVDFVFRTNIANYSGLANEVKHWTS